MRACPFLACPPAFLAHLQTGTAQLPVCAPRQQWGPEPPPARAAAVLPAAGGLAQPRHRPPSGNACATPPAGSTQTRKMALGAWNLPPAMHRLTYLVVGLCRRWMEGAAAASCTMAARALAEAAAASWRSLSSAPRHRRLPRPLSRCWQGAIAVLSGGLTLSYGASWPLLARLALGYTALVRSWSLSQPPWPEGPARGCHITWRRGAFPASTQQLYKTLL